MEHQRNKTLTHPAPPSWTWLWPSWIWSTQKPMKHLKATDAMRNPAINTRFTDLMDNTDPPETFKASHVAMALTLEELRTMGYEKWQEAMPGVMALAFEMRAVGYCEILKGKKLLHGDVQYFELDQFDVSIRRLEDDHWRESEWD